MLSPVAVICADAVLSPLCSYVMGASGSSAAIFLIAAVFRTYPGRVLSVWAMAMALYHVPAMATIVNQDATACDDGGNRKNCRDGPCRG